MIDGHITTEWGVENKDEKEFKKIKKYGFVKMGSVDNTSLLKFKLNYS